MSSVQPDVWASEASDVHKKSRSDGLGSFLPSMDKLFLSASSFVRRPGPSDIKIAQKIIQKWDVEVDLAENGLVAIEKFKANKYHIILMDLSMPIMDGYEATAEIRKTDKLIPIIALSASASFGYLDRALQIGINEYIIKPFNPKELNMKLHKYANFL